MTFPLRTAQPTPYAIAFSIEELLLVRSWAQQRGLHLTVATDQVLNGAEFEEMLILAIPGRQTRTLTLWRNAVAVFAQTSHSRPRAFEKLKDVLDTVRPIQKSRSGWRRLLGRVG